MNPIIIYPNRDAATTHTTGAFIIVPVLLWISYESFCNKDDIFLTLLTLGGAAAYIVMVQKAVKNLKSNQPLLIIDKEGITDNASVYPVGNIPWTDITRMSITSSLNKALVLHLHLNDSKKYIKLMQDKYKNARIKKTHPKTFTIKIYDSLLPMSAKDLMETIKEARKVFEQQQSDQVSQ